MAQLGLLFRVSHWAAIKLSARAEVISRFNWRQICFQVHSVVVGRNQFVVSCCTYWEDLSSMLAVGRRSLLFPSYTGFSNMASCFVNVNNPRKQEKEWERSRKRKSTSKIEVTVLYNLIMEGLSHYFCWILFMRSQSQNPVHTPREGMTQGVSTREQDH